MVLKVSYTSNSYLDRSHNASILDVHTLLRGVGGEGRQRMGWKYVNTKGLTVARFCKGQVGDIPGNRRG